MSLRQHVHRNSLLKKAIHNNIPPSFYVQELEKKQNQINQLNKQIHRLQRIIQQKQKLYDQLSDEVSDANRTIDTMEFLCGAKESLKKEIRGLLEKKKALEKSIRHAQQHD